MLQKAALFGLVLATLALILSAVALGIPYWQNLDTGTVTGNHGLFRYIVTSSGTETSGDYLDYLSDSDEKTSLKAVRGLVISGAALLLLAVLSGLPFMCGVEYSYMGGYFAVACAVLSSFLHAAGSLVFRYKLAGSGNSSLHAGFYLVSVAAGLGTIAAGLLLKAACRAERIEGGDSQKSWEDRCNKYWFAILQTILMILAVACSAVSAGLSYWQTIDTGTETGHHGVFRYTITSSGQETSGNYIDYLDSKGNGDGYYLKTVRILVVVGGGGLLVGLLSLMLYNCEKKQKCPGVFATLCCFASAALHVTAVVIFRVKLKLGGASSLHAGFYLSIAAASIGFLVGVLMIVAVVRLRAKVNSEQGNREPKLVDVKPLLDSPQAEVGAVGLLIGFLALACSGVSLGLPYWQNLNTGTLTGNHGLFQYTVTTSGTETSGDYANLLTGSEQTSLYAVRGLSAAGTGCILAAFVFGLVLVCANKRWASITGAVFFFLSVAAHVCAVVVFRVKLKGAGSSTFHAGFYLAIGAAVVGLICGILFLVGTCISGDNGEDKKDDTNEQENKTERKKPTPKPAPPKEKPTKPAAANKPTAKPVAVIKTPVDAATEPDTKHVTSDRDMLVSPSTVVFNKDGLVTSYSASPRAELVEPMDAARGNKRKVRRVEPARMYTPAYQPKIQEIMDQADMDGRRAVWKRETAMLSYMKY